MKSFDAVAGGCRAVDLRFNGTFGPVRGTSNFYFKVVSRSRSTRWCEGLGVRVEVTRELQITFQETNISQCHSIARRANEYRRQKFPRQTPRGRQRELELKSVS